MMIGLKQPMKGGEKVKGTLVFQRAGTIEVDYKIEPLGARNSGGSGHDHSGQDHSGHAVAPKKVP
jgi:periplasmic copper chaperone A